MCGIAGLLGGLGGETTLKTMLRLMQHRGPDGEGIKSFQNGATLIGHRRLAIIDLSTGGQPMQSPDNRFTLTFNGEIYNYIELRSQLEQKGWHFKTSSDTEVLLAGLIVEGPDFLKKTNGMFALALWDNHEQNLLLARDRVGIKPLYISEPKPGSLAFSSELRSLMAVKGIEQSLNLQALESYLTFRFVPCPMTIIQGINKFPPAHYANFKNGKLTFTRYWDVNIESPAVSLSAMDRIELIHEFKDLLSSSVSYRLRSDVSYGAFLSGGIDSSVIASLMTQASGERINTYSIGFSGIDDERQQAREIAKSINSNHHEIEMEPNDLWRLPEAAYATDEPFPDPIILAMYMLAEKASKDVKVILTGEGADELLGGYVHHPHLNLLSKAAPWIPSFLQKTIARTAKGVPNGLFNSFFKYPASASNKEKERLSLLIENIDDDTQRYLSYVSLFTESERNNLLSDEANEALSRSTLRPANLCYSISFRDQNKTYINAVWTHEYKTWLPDNILFKQDKTLMGQSIEGRIPFCDHRLIEFSQTLPHCMRYAKNNNKVILREIAPDVLNVNSHPNKKHPFMVPMEGRYGEVLHEMSKDCLSSQKFKQLGYFNEKAVEKLLSAFPSSSIIAGKQLMSLLNFHLWNEAIGKCRMDISSNG